MVRVHPDPRKITFYFQRLLTKATITVIMSRKRIGLITLFSFTAVLSLVAALGAITSYIFEDEVLPQTMVAGISVGGLSYPAAQAIINQKATELSTLNVTFKLNDKSANA